MSLAAEAAMLRLAAHTHYLPDKYIGKAHTPQVCTVLCPYYMYIGYKMNSLLSSYIFFFLYMCILLLFRSETISPVCIRIASSCFCSRCFP